jgi:hypothetical protein
MYVFGVVRTMEGRQEEMRGKKCTTETKPPSRGKIPHILKFDITVETFAP